MYFAESFGKTFGCIQLLKRSWGRSTSTLSRSRGLDLERSLQELLWGGRTTSCIYGERKHKGRFLLTDSRLSTSQMNRIRGVNDLIPGLWNGEVVAQGQDAVTEGWECRALGAPSGRIIPSVCSALAYYLSPYSVDD